MAEDIALEAGAIVARVLDPPEPAGSCEFAQGLAREIQERPAEPRAFPGGAARHGGESVGSCGAQELQQDRLGLIVAVVAGQ